MRLYRFLDADYGLKSIEERRLKISNMLDLNDPFDLLAFDMSDKYTRTKFKETIEQVAQENGLICFSEGWDNPVIWSHYADKHKGICLGFDVPDHTLMKVNYQDHRVVFPYDQILNLTNFDDYPEDQQNLLVREFRKCLCTKYSHWSYEREWRAFVNLDQRLQGEKHYFTDFEDNMVLKEVIVGCKSKVTRNQLDDVLGDLKSGVKTFKVRPAFKQFKIVKNQNGKCWK
ncbi:hypothetical protein GCM10017044_28720 [Kordiimonas sediminis]|uniref:DUF2971 domain-containing protein n=1 Tax=Kordiimonas sediminis TaxID=1735581 RepID=A0A919E9I0_9PROT|nr:DUF2971 domain-containing protein [Kordiimonas sediminis]GHF31412.1 hypothetical protein GCM10017044_28720 [Kordiimonas sediminis]